MKKRGKVVGTISLWKKPMKLVIFEAPCTKLSSLPINGTDMFILPLAPDGVGQAHALSLWGPRPLPSCYSLSSIIMTICVMYSSLIVHSA